MFILSVCISHGFDFDLGIIARATGKVIARVKECEVSYPANCPNFSTIPNHIIIFVIFVISNR